jgi:hypothetical protein
MKIIGLILISAIITKFALGQEKRPEFDRSNFYAVMARDNLPEVEALLKTLQKDSFIGKQAFEGTLLMKKAGLVSNPKSKLSLFKLGHNDLETELKRDSRNAEFHFLRLITQEHVPGVVHYRDKLQEDSLFIRRYFKYLTPEVQHAIVDYSKKSKVLKFPDS